MIRLIATDIDGTLLPAGSTNPPPEMVELLREYLDRGVVIALASGRPLSALDNLFPELNDRLIYICSNGTRVVQNKKNISLSPVAVGEELSSIMRAVRELHCDFMVDSSEITLVEDSVSDTFYRLIQAAGIRVEKVNDITEYPAPILKISIAHPNGPRAVCNYPDIMRFGERYTLIPTGGVFFDIITRQADKGTAVKAIQQQFGIKPEETVVFGDAMNDVPLFGTTPNSYAVESAPAEVRSYAKYTVLPPEAGGVLRCLSELLQKCED